MFSVMISGVLFFSQAMVIAKPIISLGAFLLGDGSGDHGGI